MGLGLSRNAPFSYPAHQMVHSVPGYAEPLSQRPQPPQERPRASNGFLPHGASPGKLSDASSSASATWIPTGNGTNVTFDPKTTSRRDAAGTKTSTPNTANASTPDIGISA